MLSLTIALDVVLTSGEVPHEVAHVHVVNLVAEEELEVLEEGRDTDSGLGTVVVGHHGITPLYAAQQTLVGCSMAVVVAVHAGEEHVHLVFVFLVIAYDFILVLLVGRGLLLALIDGSSLLALGRTVLIIGYGGVIDRTIEEGTLTVLLTSQVLAEGEDILGRVLVHGGIGCTAYHDDGIGTVANHDEQHAQQGGVLETDTDEVVPPQGHGQKGQNHHTDDKAGGAMTIEGNTQQGHAQEVGHVAAHEAAAYSTLPDGPQHHTYQDDEVDDETGVEPEAQLVDEKQFKPAPDLDDAGHNAVEYHHDEDTADQKRQERTLEVGSGELAVVVDEHQGRKAQQVEQVDTDAQTRHVGNEDEPAVTVRLVGMVFPLQHQPHYKGCEEGGIGIHLTLHG